MRKIEFVVGSLLWFAAAALTPMAALEPVQSTPAAPAAVAVPTLTAAGLW